MGIWVLIAVFSTIALTALLIRVLMGVNGQGRGRSAESEDGGAALAGDSDRQSDHGVDGGDSGDGGGDGGGGGD